MKTRTPLNDNALPGSELMGAEDAACFDDAACLDAAAGLDDGAPTDESALDRWLTELAVATEPLAPTAGFHARVEESAVAELAVDRVVLRRARVAVPIGVALLVAAVGFALLGATAQEPVASSEPWAAEVDW